MAKALSKRIFSIFVFIYYYVKRPAHNKYDTTGAIPNHHEDSCMKRFFYQLERFTGDYFEL